MGRGADTIVSQGPALAVRLADGVSLRMEPFGAIAYVAERDDFFALDHAYADVALRAVTAGSAPGDDAERARVLASLGICATVPATPQRPHLGRSLVGDLTGLPLLDRPLVVNCFSTAQCPLRCAYCHADDLMVPFRRDETWQGVEAVARTAARVPAMVGVVTGGDPIVRPERAAWLVARLAPEKRVVLDTSGVGDIRPLLPVLSRHRVHVRVSLDSADPGVNDRARPVSPGHLGRGASAWRYAHTTVRRLQEAGVPCSVQTVVGSHNDSLRDLLVLRDHLLAIGVRHWVLHVAVPAGKAARHRGVLPGEGAVDRVRALVAECAGGGVPLDIRVTGTHRTPNSVLLIDPLGRLCVERADGGGKQVIWNPGEAGHPGAGHAGVDLGISGEPEPVTRYRRYVDPAGHASRYLNGTLEPTPQRVAVA